MRVGNVEHTMANFGEVAIETYNFAGGGSTK